MVAFDDPSTPEATTTATTVAIIEQVPPQGSPTPAPPTMTAAPTTTPNGLGACATECLVRLQEPGDADRQTLIDAGLKPAYGRDGWLWAVAPSETVDRLVSDGIEVTVVEQSSDTLPLYVVRFPTVEEIDESLVSNIGDVIDQVDNQLLVEAPEVMVNLNDLGGANVTIDKVLPPQSLTDRSNLPDLLGPGIVADGVSIDELTRTMADLQSTGGEAGEYGSRANRTPDNVIAADYIAKRMLALGLSVRYQDFASWDGSYQVNVIGELPGKDPSKVYLVLAHYDSINLDGGVAPGADDNASGIAAMLEMARILSAYQLRYPVQFLATSAEEEDMYGAAAFAKEAASNAVPYDAAFNLDSLGWADRPNELVINGDEDTIPIQNVMASINDVFGLGEHLVIRQNPGIIADDSELRKQGIPTILIARALYGENPVHHTGRDTLDLVDIPAVKSAADLVLLTIAEFQSG
jgi:hypothetical protein